MKYFSVKLNEVYREIGGHECVLTAYLPDDPDGIGIKGRRPGVLIMPGGGYWAVSGREGEPVAFRFNSEGFAAFVLEYSVAGKSAAKFPVQLLQACFAMKYIRDNAADFGLDGTKLFAIGFSAGGHLCGSLGLLYNSERVRAVMPDFEKARPSAMILCYPVISSGDCAHRGSFDNLLHKGENPETVSLEKAVTENAPPAFVWHTSDDSCVPVLNPILLAAAYAEKKAPMELHIFEKGAHGLSLSNCATAAPGDRNMVNEKAAVWFGLLMSYLKDKI